MKIEKKYQLKVAQQKAVCGGKYKHGMDMVVRKKPGRTTY